MKSRSIFLLLLLSLCAETAGGEHADAARISEAQFSTEDESGVIWIERQWKRHFSQAEREHIFQNPAFEVMRKAMLSSPIHWVENQRMGKIGLMVKQKKTGEAESTLGMYCYLDWFGTIPEPGPFTALVPNEPGGIVFWIIVSQQRQPSRLTFRIIAFGLPHQPHIQPSSDFVFRTGDESLQGGRLLAEKSFLFETLMPNQRPNPVWIDSISCTLNQKEQKLHIQSGKENSRRGRFHVSYSLADERWTVEERFMSERLKVSPQ